MAVEQAVYDIGFLKAATDLSAKQFYIVYLSAADTVNVATAAHADMVGVLQNKPAATGRTCQVRRFGVTKVEAGDTITVGNKLTSDSAGKAVPAAATERFCGVALEAGGAGQTLTMLMDWGYLPA